jgi:HEPN domain-containing protein
MPDSTVSAEWYAQGDLDIQAAAILLSQNGPLPVIAFHIQQSIEKYLKGYLLSTGWHLRRIHDLEVLIQEATTTDNDFASYLDACQRITEYYIETRYPVGFATVFQKEALNNDLRTVRRLADLIHEKTCSAATQNDNHCESLNDLDTSAATQDQ